MSRTDFYTTTALGLCLAVAPLGAAAQSSGAGLAEATMFVPLVQACVEAPTAAECLQIHNVITRCAEDLEFVQCEPLFEDASAVFDDPAQLEQAQQMLLRTSEAIALLDFTDAEMSEPELVEGLTESLADAEQAAIDALAEAEVAAEADAEATAEQRLRDTLEAEERAADEAAEAAREAEIAEDRIDAEAEAQAEMEAEAAAEAQAAAEAEREVEQRLREALEAEQRAEEDADSREAEIEEDQIEAEAEVELEAEREAEERLREALEAQQRAEADAAEAERTDVDEPIDETAERDERELEVERARVRAEAEAMGEEEPELVVEEAPEEEFVAPADTPRALDTEQQTTIERLMQTPDVAAAIALLGGMAAETDEEVAPDQPRSGVAAALSALRSDRRREVEEDEIAEAEPAEEVIEDQITVDEIRTSRDDFGSRFALDFEAGQARRDESRDLERAGLVALGALAVGMLVNRSRVVARSDERVVVMRDDGEYEVWRDDDVILREEGSQRRIERYADGSTLTRWDRSDGSQIFTIRDATGRVLLRERILPDGTSIELVNDMRDLAPIDISILPPPQRRELRITQRTDPELALALLREAEADARALDRAFTLRQIREVRELRELVPVLSPDPITFEINRANVRAEEAPKLAQVGRLIERLIADNPRELFLVEGHTDATGPASYNLALSDRRAESVALALTEFFNIPPENLIIQGYGERYLRIPTVAAEERNRRVAIRRISPLLGL